jgi:hypothetical protein
MRGRLETGSFSTFADRHERLGTMKRLIAIELFLIIGLLAGRFWQALSANAEVGGGVQECTTLNGDVTANGVVDFTDALEILRWFFLGNPAELPPICPPNSSSVIQTGARDLVTASLCGTPPAVGQDAFYQAGRCPPEGRFVDNGDGTVTDTCTGLMWQQETADTNGNGEAERLADRIVWCEALDFCEDLSFAGHDDWRLPHIRDLLSIVDYSQLPRPPIYPVFDLEDTWYWSSTYL